MWEKATRKTTDGRCTHLTTEERHYIETRHKLKDSTIVIAFALSRSQSTISRELMRNCGQRGYRHQQAHGKAQQRHADKPKAIKLIPALVSEIDGMLEQQWSPEQVSGRLKQNGKASVCHLCPLGMKPSISMC